MCHVSLSGSGNSVTHCSFPENLKAVITVNSGTEGNACLKSSSINLILLSMSQYLVSEKIFVPREPNTDEMHYYF